ncbi:hypothetical protein ACVILL_002600 [Bradyrhizobium sp. USDA 3364]
MRALVSSFVANAFAQAFPVSSLRANVLKQIALLCGSVLFVWLLSLTYGLDLSVAFF